LNSDASSSDLELSAKWSLSIDLLERIFIDPEFSSVLKVPEIRLNHDLEFSHNLRNIHLSHRYRMEERFIRKKLDNSLIDGYRFVEPILCRT